MQRQRLIILKNSGGELANQLWNYVSIYAYALHVKASVRNPSFFEYHRYFNLWKEEALLTRFISFWFRGPVRRRAHPINQFWRRLYSIYVKVVIATHGKSICSSETQDSSVIYLPPSGNTPVSDISPLYFLGWLFRNPRALETYREALQKAFVPAPRIQERIATLTSSFDTTRTAIGIHFRQGDYKVFKDGAYLLSATRIREVIDEYAMHKGLAQEEILLFIASDAPVPAEAFSGYSLHISQEDAVTDLFILSRTSIIIGSNSSFGHFASWYGNIPHIIVTNQPVDWEYYANHQTYFPNKYATLAHT